MLEPDFRFFVAFAVAVGLLRGNVVAMAEGSRVEAIGRGSGEGCG